MVWVTQSLEQSKIASYIVIIQAEIAKPKEEKEERELTEEDKKAIEKFVRFI